MPRSGLTADCDNPLETTADVGSTKDSGGSADIMSMRSADQIDDTVRIRKPSRVTTDERGRTVWMGGVDPCELQLSAAAETEPYNSAHTDVWWQTRAE